MDSEMTAFEVLDEISSAWAGKQIYFLQENGLVYGRYECKYMTLEEAVGNMAERLGDEELWCPDDCPYMRIKNCDYAMMKDAHEIIAKLVPEKPRAITMGFACGSCDKYIERNYEFCPWCGRKVAWE